jgi:methionyl-tRNA formyltransferase
LQNYIVAAVGSWNKSFFDCSTRDQSDNWYYADSPEQLDKMLLKVKPRYIFFPHWRWIVSESIVGRYECICFHMTDLPYGRGGSPLQNLIVRGYKETMLTALRMTGELDAGPIYLKEPLSLLGSAEEIYRRASELAWRMIRQLIAGSVVPVPQSGKPTYFKRRTPDQSEIPEGLTLDQVYDYIRMMDAPGYPKAFVRQSGKIIEFSKVGYVGGDLTASVTIRNDNLEP